MTHIGDRSSLPTALPHLEGPDRGAAPPSTSEATKGSSFRGVGDQYEVAAPLLRFQRFADPVARRNPFARWEVNPRSEGFETNMGRKYAPETFATWAAIAVVMQRFMQMMVQQIAQQMAAAQSTIQPAGPGGSPPGYGPYTPGLPSPSELPQPPVTPRPTPIADTTPTAVSGYGPERLRDTELFGVNGPQAVDVRQGELGDCYFLSALGGVATEDPNVIRNNIRPHVDPATGLEVPGQYDVRFYKHDAEGDVVEEWVTVNDRMLRDRNGNELYAQTTDTDHDGNWEQWAAIYEKGYAVFSSRNGNVDQGYDEIGGGGWGGEAYFAITGREANGDNPTSMDRQDLLDILNRTNPTNGDVVMLGSIGGNDSMLQAEGLPGGHMYQVLGTYEDPTTGETMVTLRNPWGSFEPGMVPDGHGGFRTNDSFDGTNDGIFSIPLSQVQRDFDLVTYDDKSQYDLSKARYPEIRS